MSELRREPITGRWVIMSPERNRSCSSYPPDERGAGGASCPLCPGSERLIPQRILETSTTDPSSLPGAPSWAVRVVPSRIPALRIEGTLIRSAEGLYDRMTGIGAHEIVIQGPAHGEHEYHLTDGVMESVVRALRERVNDLKRDQRFEYIMVFKNCGRDAGAAIAHPHAQIIALPVVPSAIREELSGGKNYFEHRERCVFCDIIAQELAASQRIVAENDSFVAFCPFAARFPFEVWILPRVHEPRFEDSGAQPLLLAQIMKAVLGRLSSALDHPQYNYVFHSLPLRDQAVREYHWHIEITPRLFQGAGFEWASGCYINPVLPEESARFLRGD